MEWESRHAIFLEWVRHNLVQELVRFLPPRPRLEFGSQKERQIHKRACGIQPQRHRSRLHHDLVRRVYERLIATQVFWHLLQHRRLGHHNLSCCQHPHMKFETQIAPSRQGFGHYHRQIQQTRTMPGYALPHPRQECDLHLPRPSAFFRLTSLSEHARALKRRSPYELHPVVLEHHLQSSAGPSFAR